MAGLPIPESPGFSELTKSEQIRYLQALWDRIAAHPGELPAPESHLKLAEERLASYRHDPDGARPAHDVLDRLAKKSQ
jgi:putative addiction module component (TIGR02574 family)